jgi:serine protease Do
LFGLGGGLLIYNYVSEPSSTTTNTAAKTGTENKVVINQSVSSPNNLSTTSSNDVVNATAIAQNSVVEITTETVATSSFFGQYVTEGAGSGVIISEDGYIITCDHVIEGASSVTVTLTNGVKYDATVVGGDKQTDIAILKINADEKLTASTIGSSTDLLVGETVIAIGNPLGTLGGSVSTGIVSALDREIDIDGQKYKLLQTNAAINPGNSGGGLFNINGELIGVVNAKQSGTVIEGLGFAIPIDSAIKIAEELITNGYISGRPQLGVLVQEINANTTSSNIRNSEYSALINYIDDYGVYFLDYQKNQSGDLSFGDRIVAINDIPVSTLADITSILQDFTVGDSLTLTVVRKTIDGRSVSSKMVQAGITLVESVPQTTETE